MAGVLVAVFGASVAAGQPLFPEPFVVEHRIVQTDPGAGVFATDPVTDYYDGSRIISVRPDGSRLMVDFSARQLTEILPEHQAYAVLSFNRFVELRDRLRELELAGSDFSSEGEEIAVKAGEPEEAEFDVAELSVVGTKAAGEDLTARPGVRRLRVVLRPKSGAGSGAAVDVWLDPSVRLGPGAMTALERFENEVLGSTKSQGVGFSRYVAAARKHAGGAFPIRTLRPIAVQGDGSEAGTVEDVAVRLEPVAALPPEILVVPEGFRRIPHRLEQLVSFAEEEAELRGKMSAPDPESP